MYRYHNRLRHDLFVGVAGEDECKFSFGQLRRFSLREVQLATDNFSEINIIGQGGFGKVYKGALSDNTRVAVKRLTDYHSPGGEAAFLREVQLISIAVHKNLLRLIGFCTTLSERILVYPFMQNLSVAYRLRDLKPGEKGLDWPTRKRVAFGAAQGLEYLHEHCNPKIVHRDLKAANILLDDDFEAVLGDFGLAKLVDTKLTHVTTQLFDVQLDNLEVLLRYSSALVQGATNVFWIDIQTNTRRFQSLFRYLLEEVALVPEQLKKIPLQAQRDLFLLLSRFMLFYNLDKKLESFLKQFPDFPTAFFVGGPADILVIELTDQLQKLKVEPVLLHYLSQIKVLQGLELRMTTSTRLKTCLYSFTSPGGPMYPTRAVRHAAWDALDFLFPVGRYPRHLISLFFRLLYPWYWPSSCWNFIKACIQAVLYSILSLIFSVWEKLGKAKDS